jgi:excisionase family DNA binding protein
VSLDPTSPAPPVVPGHSSKVARSERSELLTADDLAKRWRLPRTDQVYRLAREGKLPAVRIGRYVRFRLEAIEIFEREGGTADG